MDDMSRRKHVYINNTSTNLAPSEYIDVEVGKDPLGIELAANSGKTGVVVKSVAYGPSSKVPDVKNSRRFTIPSGSTINRINDVDVSEWNAERIIETLQVLPHPFAIRFRKNSVAYVLCKLCETKISAEHLNAHTTFCIKSKQHELCIEHINEDLERFANQVLQLMNAPQAISKHCCRYRQYAYSLLLDSTYKVARCNVNDVDSVHLCAQLVKSLRRLRETVPRLYDSTCKWSFIHLIQYCTRLQKLIKEKIMEMRGAQKLMLQGTKYEHPLIPFGTRRSLVELKSPFSSVYPSSSCIVSIQDFDILKPISRGAFGCVYLARKKSTGDQFAIKVLGKEHVVRKKQVRNIETERDILMNVESPFVVKLFWTFQTRKNLFLVMEYLPGGDLMSLLESVVQLQEDVARTYIAEIAVALNHLHSQNCVHRDLKPDNILLSSTGHIKLTDFGLSEEGICISQDRSDHEDLRECSSNDVRRELSKLTMEARQNSRPSSNQEYDQKLRYKSDGETVHSYGRCGTPDYLSPEIILQQPHDSAVDYWALGVILYEMLVGFPPFNDNTVEAIFDNILRRDIAWPDGEKRLSAEAIDLISALLKVEPTERMTWKELKSHVFLEGVDWEKLLNFTPPFVPTLEGPNDTSYFNNRNLTDVFIDDDNEVPSGLIARTKALAIKVEKSHISDAMPVDERKDDSLKENVLCKKSAISSVSSPIVSHKVFTSSDNSIQKAEHHQKFPSGMYGRNDTTSENQKFEYFSVTNINALASASLQEAEYLKYAPYKMKSEPQHTIIL
ncbi:hypothetical protein ABG067_006914 [Albugo candida]